MKKWKAIKNRLVESNWVITLTATLFGVFLALYLNQLSSARKSKLQTDKAIHNIIEEIASNKSSLETGIVKQKEYLNVLYILQKYLNDKDQIIAPRDSLLAYVSKYPDHFLDKDSIRFNGNQSEYFGEVEFKFTATFVNLNTIAWETLKNSAIGSSLDFDCLMYLEGVNKLTEEVLERDKKVLAFIPELKSNLKEEKLNFNLAILIQFEQSLLKAYEESKEKLRNCS